MFKDVLGIISSTDHLSMALVDISCDLLNPRTGASVVDELAAMLTGTEAVGDWDKMGGITRLTRVAVFPHLCFHSSLDITFHALWLL